MLHPVFVMEHNILLQDEHLPLCPKNQCESTFTSRLDCMVP